MLGRLGMAPPAHGVGHCVAGCCVGGEVFGGAMLLTVETEHEKRTGRWIAEVPELPGCLAYGATEAEAVNEAQALAFRIIQDCLAHGELVLARPTQDAARTKAAAELRHAYKARADGRPADWGLIERAIRILETGDASAREAPPKGAVFMNPRVVGPKK